MRGKVMCSLPTKSRACGLNIRLSACGLIIRLSGYSLNYFTIQNMLETTIISNINLESKKGVYFTSLCVHSLYFDLKVQYIHIITSNFIISWQRKICIRWIHCLLRILWVLLSAVYSLINISMLCKLSLQIKHFIPQRIWWLLHLPAVERLVFLT